MYHPLSHLLTSRHLFSSRVATWTSFALLAVLIAALPSFVQSQTPPTQPLSQPLMLGPSHGHSATLLPNGKVLIAGGENTSGTISSTDIFDPANDTFSAGPALSTSRKYHSATLLTDGHVLIAGGQNQTPLTSTEVFDPNNPIAWSVGPLLQTPRSGHSATKLADGRVVVIGGDTTGSVEIFTSTTQQFTAVPANLTTPRSFHSAALLQDGKILIVGGAGSDNKPLDSGEIYDPTTQTFSAVDKVMHTARMFSVLEVLPDGKVQIIGGSRDYSMEIYDPQLNAFGAYSNWLVNDPTIDPSPDAPTADDVLQARTRAALFHNSQNGALVGALAGLLDREEHTVTELQNNTTLIAGGLDSNDQPLNTAAVVSSSPATVSTSKTDYSPGEYVTITGAGWQSGENVSLLLHEEPAHHEDAPLWSVADQAGNFTNSDYQMEDHDAGVTYTITAKGQLSKFTAQMAFTDGQAHITGTVKSSAAGNPPISGATVSCTTSSGCNANLSTTTAADGSYDLQVSFAGTSGSVTLTASATGFTSATLGPIVVSNGTLVSGKNFILTPSVAPTTLTVAPASGTYGGTTTLSATLKKTSDSSAVSGKNISFTLNGASVGSATTNGSGVATLSGVGLAGINAGTYSTGVAASFAGDSGFSASSGTNSLTVSPKAATVVADAKSKTYGDDNPALTATVSGTINGDTLNYTLATTAAKFSNVGSYPITVTLGTNPNYSVTKTDSTLTITAKTATVAADAKSKTYGDANPALTATVTGTVNGDTLNYTLATTALQFSNVGSYPITVTLGTNPNYNVTKTDSTLTITAKTVTVAADAKSKTYGDANPALTAVVTGEVVGGDAINYSLATTALQFSNVGSYPITVTLDTNPNYNVTKTDSTLTITAKTATVAADAKSKTYGDANPALTAVVTGEVVGGDAINYSLATTALQFSNVGSYPITVTLDTNPNYNVTKTDSTLTITAKTATVAADAKSKTYGDANPALTAVVTGEVVGGDAINYSLATTALQFSNVGSYPITVTLGTNPNYNVTKTDSTLTITAKTATVAADAKSKTYGDANPALTAVVTGEVVGGDAINYSLATTALQFSNVGSYPITVTLGTNPNYNVTKIDSTLTITAKTATVAADAKSKTYGDANPLLTATETGTVNGDTLNYTLATTALQFSNVGGYPITVTLGTNPNYSVTKTDSTLTITTKAATVDADPKSKTYGDANPLLTATETGTVNGDTLNYTLATTALQFSNVGSYPITVTLGTNPNYNVTKTDSTLTITAKTATVAADAKSKTYGDANPLLTATETGTVNGDTLNYTLATTALQFSNVGSYPITVTLGTNPNYNVTKTDSTLTITAKTATVAADAKSKTYGDANPLLTATETGTVNGDTLNYTLATTALQFSNVGGYPITVTLGTNPNYNVTKIDSTLTITAKTATVVADAKSKTYGDANPALTAVVTGEVVGGDAINYSLATTAVTLSGVGSYPITVTLGTNPNYNVTKTDSTLTVTKATLAVTADDKSKIYGATNPPLTASYTGFVNGDTAAVLSGSPSLGTTATTASPVGSYPITPTVGALAATNYSFTFVNGTLTVTKAHLTVTADNKSRVYGVANPTFTATLSGFVTSEILATSGVTGSASCTSTATATTAVGTYGPATAEAITCTVGTLTATNYDFIPFVRGTLTIGAWTLNGFYQPVDMSTSTLVWNTVKNGSTVPLKFNIFAGSTERTNTSDIQSFNLGTVSCSTSGTEDLVELTTTGGTVLRYSGTPGVDGQFIQNWQTPKTANICYKVTMTAKDGSSLSAFFKLK